MKGNRKRLSGAAFWSEKPETLTADRDLDRVLGSVTRLPLRYWQHRFYFTGAGDEALQDITKGKFPKTLVRQKTHPVFALAPLPHQTGFRVCPCSSKKPFNRKIFHHIRKGCSLRHTGHIMDRDSYLVEHITFNIPASMAYRLRFRGQIPVNCIIPGKNY